MRLLKSLLLFVCSAHAFVNRGPRGARLSTLLTADAPKNSAKKATTKKTTSANDVKPEAAVTVKKAEFVTTVSEKTGMSKKDSEAAIQAVLDVFMEEVSAGKKVSFPGFGSFSLKSRAARKGRNPQTGEEIDIPESKTPGFTPAKAWKDAVNGR